LPEENLLVNSDPNRIKQVLSNLLRNAIKFTSKGTITFSCRKIGGELVFSVTDTGSGIPDEDQKLIFRRFTKFDYQGLNTEGTGIGLSIAEKIVSLMKGKIWLSSKLGEGSSFFFSIPFFQAIGKEVGSRGGIMTSILDEVKLDRSVLIVEDDQASYMFLNEILNSMDIRVVHVTNGRDAIDFIKNNSDINIVLMDIRLPIMDGYDATLAIKKLYPKIPVIAQTSYAMPGDKEKAMSVGCDDYMTKPIDPHKLAEILKKYF
jgi:CheY-like chemotaxis protein